jgi:hypothetical protein
MMKHPRGFLGTRRAAVDDGVDFPFLPVAAKKFAVAR